jgi:hypothetical protein
MTAMTSAERARKCRRKKDVAGLAAAHFDGKMRLTAKEFLDAVAFDENVFYNAIKMIGGQHAAGIEYALEDLLSAYQKSHTVRGRELKLPRRRKKPIKERRPGAARPDEAGNPIGREC